MLVWVCRLLWGDQRILRESSVPVLPGGELRAVKVEEEPELEL